MNDSHDNEAAAELRAYFEPDGFPSFTVEDGRAWTPQQVRDALTHHREYLRQIIEPTVRAVLAENETMRQQVTAMTTEYGVEWDERGGPFGVPLSRCTDEAGARYYLAERPDRKYGGENGRLVSRLVGEWQPAGPAQDEQAATGGNDNSKGN